MPRHEEKPGTLSNLLLTWIASALAVGFTAWLLPGVSVDAFWPTTFWVALAIGLANTFVRPLVVLLTLPATLLTLGLFLLVINGLMLQVADHFVDGFVVSGLPWAVIGAIVLSGTTSITQGMLGVAKDD